MSDQEGLNYEAIRTENPELFDGAFEPDELADRDMVTAANQFVVKGATDEVAGKILRTLFGSNPETAINIDTNIVVSLARARRGGMGKGEI